MPIRHSLPKDFPPIITLCGSTRFIDAYNQWRHNLTHQGYVVLSIEIVTTQAHSDDPQHARPDEKAKLDQLHLRKIDLSDSIMVLNVGGYVGESTRREIDYANMLGIPIRYLETDKGFA